MKVGHPRADAPATLLPDPPDDAELLAYLGPQRRWVFAFSAVAFLAVGFSITRFSLHAGAFYLAPFLLIAVAAALSARTSTRPRRVSAESHLARVGSYAPTEWPSVDIFLPTAGEPLDVLHNTYRWVSRVTWPGPLVVRVLDDADRSEVADLARAFGFTYSVRANRGFLKKAGNLAHGYMRSTAQFIAVLDADFAPRADYLLHLIPYFDDPTVGIVQSPQYFDTSRSMNWIQRCAGATQELFYRFIQPSRDAVGAAICVGSCGIYRRRALEAIGGFAQISHSEDVHTGVRMLAAGFGLRYVPVLVSKGLCPAELDSFLNQQYRWCVGSMSLLRDRSFHRATRITLRQRLCFWSGFGYYVSTAVAILFGSAPSLAMIWFYPELVRPINSLWLIPATVNWLVLWPVVMKGRWRADVLRVQALYSFAHVLAILHAFTGSAKDWVATGSTDTRGKTAARSVRRFYTVWLVGLMLLTWPRLIAESLRFGVGAYWAMIVMAAFVLVTIQIPVLTLGLTARTRTARHRAGALAEPRDIEQDEALLA